MPISSPQLLLRQVMTILMAFAVTLGLSSPAWSQRAVDSLLPPSESINSAVDAAASLARMLDGNMGGVSSSNLVMALEDAAEAGEPIAMWRLGIMYENGDGVEKDMVRAFGYFSRLANDYADTPRNSLQADIVAQSFIKLGDYYRDGLPDAGIRANSRTFHTLLLHAASYFGDADAQYRVGRLFLDGDEMGLSPLQSARWLSLAARKGHVAAQATLGDLLYNGAGIEPQPVEGLMWLKLARDHAAGTVNERWVNEMADDALLSATSEQKSAAYAAAESLGERFYGN